MTVLVPCRDAAPIEVWTGPARLAKAATEAGWQTRTTYAKAEITNKKDRPGGFAVGDRVTRAGVTGSIIDVCKDKTHLGVLVDGRRELATWEIAETQLVDEQGQETKVVESITVRLRRLPLAAGAVWYDGKFEHAFVWSQYTRPKRIGARGLGKFVKAAA